MVDLPPRGTGLKTGRAGDRRAGKMRTDEERAIRHESSSNNTDKQQAALDKEIANFLKMVKRGDLATDYEKDQAMMRIATRLCKTRETCVAYNEVKRQANLAMKKPKKKPKVTKETKGPFGFWRFPLINARLNFFD